MTARPTAVLLDIDGTAAEISGVFHLLRPTPERRYKDFAAFHEASVTVPVKADVITEIHAHHADGHHIIVTTSRRAAWRHQTAWFLALNDIPTHGMLMRADHDTRPGPAVKADMLAQVRRSYDVIHAYDDDPAIVDMFRAHGVPVTHVPGWQLAA